MRKQARLLRRGPLGTRPQGRGEGARLLRRGEERAAIERKRMTYIMNVTLYRPYHALRVSLPFQVDRMLVVGFQERMTGFLVPAGN